MEEIKELYDQSISDKLNTYIDRYFHDIDNQLDRGSYAESSISILETPVYRNALSSKTRELEALINKKEASFSEMLLRMIDDRGMSDVEAYKSAHIDRRLFSKIRSDKNYKPSKETVILFILALKLNLDEAYDLLQRSGYALSSSSKFDLIIQFFIEEELYDFYLINEALHQFNQKLLTF